MKTALILIVFVTTHLMAADPISDALQKGLFEEEANHDLHAAIKAYQSVLDQTAEQRKLTATAVFRLGECYRKLNKTNEAVTQYQRVVREFSDVAPLAMISRQNLAGLGFDRPKDSATTVATSDEPEEIARIKAMIKYSPDLLNAPNPSSGMTPLGSAAQNGYLAVAKFLLDNKADLEARGKGGRTALHFAVEHGHKTMVELLLDHGADINAQSGNKNRPLHIAVSKGYRSIVELLLSRKADVNAKGQSARTPLQLTFFQHRETARLLLDRGADVNAQDDKGSAVVHYAVSSPEWTKLILSRNPNLELQDRDGNTPLITAAGSRGDIESVRLLLQAGAEVNETAPAGRTPLMAAITSGDLDKVRLLLEHKADPNEKGSSAESPLEWVLFRVRNNPKTAETVKLTEIAELLRKHGAKELTADVPSIGVTRNGKEFNYNYLKQDPQGLNKFTLFELLAYLYSGRGPREGNSVREGPKFPDFSNIQITRTEPHVPAAPTRRRIINLNLEEALVSGDCSKDVLLEWGDVVDIPEKDHKLSESWTELPGEIRETLSSCLARNVSITIKGETTRLKLRPKFWGARSGGPGPLVAKDSSDGLPFLRLARVLEASKLLRASSDRTRVHVTRRTAGQLKTYYFNLEAPAAARRLPLPRSNDAEEDLLLQGGDTIYVPDKS